MRLADNNRFHQSPAVVTPLEASGAPTRPEAGRTRAQVKRVVRRQARRVLMHRMLLLGVVAVAGVIGCDDDDTMCPAIIEYREPIINITSVRDRGSGASIDSIMVTNVRLDGRVYEPIRGLAEMSQSYGVSVRGDTLICNVPCGFAIEAGNYIFTVSTPGYVTQDLGYDAQYSVFKGGCGAYYDGGLRTSIRLRHE